MGILAAQGQRYPVRIRNLSRSGAMIEGEDLPVDGLFEVKRGEEFFSGEIVWARGHRRGLEFADPIKLEKWLPTGPLGDQDDAARSESDSVGGVPEPPVDDLPIIDRVGEELDLASRRIGLVLDRFSSEPLAVVRYASEMQELEIVQQLLGRFGTILRSRDPASEANKLSIEDVRRRLLR